ncbi:hypothetical protein GT347_04700 [Xylophilus rhododendri]|uniref:Uncharacterized protein n=1 Tax=Xylophilus rhododendri TaxID=2697032 RepID=A0A857J0E6_9BURK|nr:hypothetical protein [Xylophilus rhododendri]QHI97340.1 hypothetical protein GT347_04700 [Xylophilus rhododendri]
MEYLQLRSLSQMVTPAVIQKDLVWRISLTGLLLFGSMTAEASETPLPKTFYGDYKIIDVLKVSGGLTSDEQAKKSIGSHMCIRKDIFTLRSNKINYPVYKYLKKAAPERDSEIDEPNTPLFFGIEKDRQTIETILVYENMKAVYPFEKIEALPSGRYVNLFDGHAYFLRKTSAKCP